MAQLDEFLTVGFQCLVCNSYFEVKSYSYYFLVGIALTCPHCGADLFVFDNLLDSILIAAGQPQDFN